MEVRGRVVSTQVSGNSGEGFTVSFSTVSAAGFRVSEASFMPLWKTRSKFLPLNPNHILYRTLTEPHRHCQGRDATIRRAREPGEEALDVRRFPVLDSGMFSVYVDTDTDTDIDMNIYMGIVRYRCKF